MQVVSTRQWEKDKLAEIVAEVIRRFSDRANHQVNIAAPTSQKSLAVSVIEALEKKGHLT